MTSMSDGWPPAVGRPSHFARRWALSEHIEVGPSDGRSRGRTEERRPARLQTFIFFRDSHYIRKAQ